MLDYLHSISHCNVCENTIFSLLLLQLHNNNTAYVHRKHVLGVGIRPDLATQCSLAIEVGLCNSLELRWFFNLTSSKCEVFNYTGCRGNHNRFDSVSECMETCDPNGCPLVTCKMMCPFGWAQDDKGCDICQCVNPCKVNIFIIVIIFIANNRIITYSIIIG